MSYHLQPAVVMGLILTAAPDHKDSYENDEPISIGKLIHKTGHSLEGSG
jgi:hypothetical protein